MQPALPERGPAVPNGAQNHSIQPTQNSVACGELRAGLDYRRAYGAWCQAQPLACQPTRSTLPHGKVNRPANYRADIRHLAL